MKLTTCLAALVLALSAVQAPAVAKDFLRADGTRIVDADGRPVVLRGMGLGGWMLQEGYMLELNQFGTQRVIRRNIEQLIGPQKTAAFYTAWLDNHTTKADVDAMARWGFNSIRLPMHYALYTLPVEQEPVKGEQTWLEEGFRRTDALLAWAKANDMYLILDLHAAPGGQGNDNNISDRDPAQSSLWDDPANQEKMIALWRKLAERYKDEPYIGAYDIINEPNWGFADRSDRNGCKEAGNAPLRDLLVRTTAAIREIDKRHIVIIEGNCWGNNYAGVFDQGLWDDNLVLSFHKYWDATTPDTLAKMLALRDRHRVPLWLGESGENSNDWFARAIALVEGEGIGWSWWPLKKIRYNNPLQIVPNDGYAQLLAYWDGKGAKPSAEVAEQALMRLASHDVRYENNIQHPDVIDALFRAPHSLESVPFAEHRLGPRGLTVAAVDFDMGRDGVAYRDLTPANERGIGPERVTWNPGMTYRNDGVDLGKRQDGSLQVVGMEKGEWLKYTIDVDQAGRYALALQGEGKGRAWVQVNGDRLAGTADPAAGELQVMLLPGRNTLIVGAERGKFDLRALRLTATP